MVLEFDTASPALMHLHSADARLSRLIQTVGIYRLELDHDYFLKIVTSIVGQQLSVKAKETIWNRIESICSPMSPKNVLRTDFSEFRKAGLSMAKIGYIKEFTVKVLSGQIKLEDLNNVSDSEVINLLTDVKGIGQWTAEMFLIFCLGRLDVFSLSDAGLRRSIKWLYELQDKPTRSEMDRISESWQPFRSVASLYLWEVINSGLISKSNPGITNSKLLA